MSSDMVLRVANAIRLKLEGDDKPEARTLPIGKYREDGCFVVSSDELDAWEKMTTSLAGAVIKSMREPTDAIDTMLDDAGPNEMKETDDGSK
jgi:ACT domain-containing protein